MSKKFDFILEDDFDIMKTVFRFYPKNTHVHSFDENPPKNWKEVYKVYYSWGIILEYFDDCGRFEGYERLFYLNCDECSKIPSLSSIIKNVINTGETYDYPTFGQPAGNWKISQRKGFFDVEKTKPYEFYDFEVFDNFKGNGVKFSMDRQRTLEFCDYLDKINEYALAHGEEI